MDGTGPALLVSVRDVEEARAALEGGAGLIDIKEPARGPLGRADDAVIRAIAELVGTRRPVSAALGEWLDGGPFPDAPLTYVKWGLAGCGKRPGWRAELAECLARPGKPRLVLAGYADWECAQAPPLDDVCSIACDYLGSVLLIDTHCKTASTQGKRPTLLDWAPLGYLADLVSRCHRSQVKIALAGSLGPAEIEMLAPLRPDWIAVRAAACAESDRHAAIDAERVRRLVALLKSASKA